MLTQSGTARGWPAVCSFERMNHALCASFVAISIVVVGCSASATPTGDAATGSTAALCIARGLCTHATSPAPPGFPQDYCWNGCNWCTCSAAGQLDICTAQACDAGPRGDASTANDAAADASVRNDAGIDCSRIGCGAPPVCGTACDAPCGCCPCTDGTEMGTYVCQGGCWAPRGTGASGSACAATSDCGSGLSCCYPCGIPGCTNQCMPTCAPRSPGCGPIGCPLFR